MTVRQAASFSLEPSQSRTLLLFLQAEDGIRDWSVTGLQTCAFFFSSRRRHTRLVSDWSSDVCSSDLALLSVPSPLIALVALVLHVTMSAGNESDERTRHAQKCGCKVKCRHPLKIGRASCRERV